MTFKSKMMIAGATAVLALAGAGSAAQAAGLITNGNFTACTGSYNCSGGTTAASNISTNYAASSVDPLTGWTATGYAFVFTSGSSTPIPHNFGNGGLNNIGAVPAADVNFIAIDPLFDGFNPHATPAGGISQTVGGLTSGLTYTLTFDWAGAQQNGYSGATTEWWTVDFGQTGNVSQDGTHSTTPTSPASSAPTSWLTQSYTFMASGSSELITFLAQGTGLSGEPPFDLLANVSLTPPPSTVPEPASIALFGAGIAGLGGLAVARRRKKKA